MSTPLDLCKLLLDEERLRLIGLIAMQPRSHAELLEILSLKPGVLARHLYQLQESGLVGLINETGGDRYTLNTARIHRWKQQLFAQPDQEPPQSPTEEMLVRFVKQGRLTHLPTQPSKLEIVLAWLAEKFEWGVDYPESEVNDILSGHEPDHAVLRRALVDYQFLTRQGGIYRRADKAVTGG